MKLLAGLGASPADRASALALAGLALSDLPADRVLPDTRQNLATATLEAFTANPPIVEPTLRRPLGLALGAVGDPRFASPTPGVEAVTIPSGLFHMGTSEEEAERLKAQNAESWDDEKPQHTVFVSEFAIGKYPVTNAEYRLFWEAKGYDNQNYWSDDGWRWQTGKLDADLSFITDEKVRKNYSDWLAGRPAEKRGQPFFWDDPTWNAPNLPVVGVTWYEAEAYCKWLSAMTGERYRLPAEAEWEKAARGPRNSLWPWGDEWDPNRCNSVESKFSATTPVGMYPNGTYLNGPLDMVGNVWEWCADWFDSKIYADREGQETLDPLGPASGSTRVVRGGSWDDLRWNSRAACRYGIGPADFDVSIGFRVARSPVLRS